MEMQEEKMEFNEKYDHKLIEDHEYDNIRELDNPAPFWLMGLFYVTIIFSVIYGAYYFWLGMGDLQAAEYEKEVAAAEINIEKDTESGFDETNIAILTDEASLKVGAEIFATKTCVTCHGAKGEGNAIGPNMTDEYFIHGNTPEEMFQTIKNGVPAKGMTPFKGQLSEEEMVQVISFILLKLQGSSPDNAKDPQGEKLGLYSIASTSDTESEMDTTAIN